MPPLLIGETRTPGFARLRLRQFSRALPHAHVLDWRDTTPASPSAILSAGTYGPTRTALARAAKLPLWLDLPGDPFADAQAATDEHPPAPGAALLTFAPALVRGDAFSTISDPARFALLGQLGLLNRLAPLAPGVNPVHTIELAWDFPQKQGQARQGSGPLKISLLGSFNGWFDAETLAEGLLMAADQQAVDVQVLGGQVAGHSERGFTRFQERVKKSRHTDCFRFLPMVEEEELEAVLLDREVGICLDRPGFEPVFGSRSRVLFWRYMGLKVIATTQTTFCQELAAMEQLVPVQVGDAVALKNTLLSIRELSTPDPEPLSVRFAPSKILAHLIGWAQSPTRLPIIGQEPLLALQQQHQELLNELSKLRNSPTWKLLNRLHRFLKL